jgi:chemotaxis protein CheX
MTLTMEPSLGDVHAVVEEVWSSFLGAEEPILPLPTPLPPGGWMAAITVSGGWDAQVTVNLSDAGALHVTSTMLMCPVEECSDEDLRDALGELVNMVGGNIKSLMPGPSVLSLPAVAAGRAVHPTGSVELARFDGVWAGQPVRVTVHVIPQP